MGKLTHMWLAGVVLSLAAACSSTDHAPERFTVRDSAGIQIVESGLLPLRALLVLHTPGAAGNQDYPFPVR